MSLRFDPTGGLIVVPTQLWGPRGDAVLRLALDTGATNSVVSWNMIVLLGYDPAVMRDRDQIITGSGVEFVPRITLEKITALEQERRDFNVLCHTLPPGTSVDGVLGLDFLRRQRLVVDFRRGLVTLK